MHDTEDCNTNNIQNQRRGAKPWLEESRELWELRLSRGFKPLTLLTKPVLRMTHFHRQAESFVKKSGWVDGCRRDGIETSDKEKKPFDCPNQNEHRSSGLMSTYGKPINTLLVDTSSSIFYA